MQSVVVVEVDGRAKPAALLVEALSHFSPLLLLSLAPFASREEVFHQTEVEENFESF